MEKRRDQWKEENQFVRRSILLPTQYPPATAEGGDHKDNNHNDQEELVEKLYSKRGSEVQQADVKLAATAISLNIRLKSADMPFSMQERALLHTSSLLTPNNSPPSRRPNLTLLARSLKKEFDRVYGPAWHCVVGKSFGSFVTHTPGGFVYFTINHNQIQNQNEGSSSSPLSFLLYKTEVHLVNVKTPPLPIPASPS